jgi:membrane protease YdiL (CAAX protease family)
MLFSIKNHVVPTLVLLALLVAGCLWARAALHLAWRIAPYPGFARDAAIGLGIVLASDALVHGVLSLVGRHRYRASYRALAEFFRPQGPWEIGAGSLLAGGEELFFRGVLLEGLMTRASLGAAASLIISALLFGALHRLPEARLAPFTLWAIWEGIVLGGVYLAFGSLLVSIVVHAAHDLIGFTLFAWERHFEGKPIERRTAP